MLRGKLQTTKIKNVFNSSDLFVKSPERKLIDEAVNQTRHNIEAGKKLVGLVKWPDEQCFWAKPQENLGLGSIATNLLTG